MIPRELAASLFSGVSCLAPQDVHGCFRFRFVDLVEKEKKTKKQNQKTVRSSTASLERVNKKEPHSSCGGGGCALYPILLENLVAKLVSDPWFCAAVTSQVGLRAHFIHQFFAGLGSAGNARILCGAAVLGAERGAGGTKRGLRGSLSLGRAGSYSTRLFLPFPGVTAQQTITFSCYACYFYGFINNLTAPVGIDCYS